MITIINAPDAPCTKVDPDLFFPEGPGSMQQEDEVKNVCYGCQFAVTCFKTAYDEKYEGVWGASSERDRRRMRKNPTALKVHLKLLTSFK